MTSSMSHGNRSPPGLCVRERVSQLTSDRVYSSFESEFIPRQTSSFHTQTLTWVKVLVRRSLYTRSLTGLLKFGPGVRASSIHVPCPWQPGNEKANFTKKNSPKKRLKIKKVPCHPGARAFCSFFYIFFSKLIFFEKKMTKNFIFSLFFLSFPFSFSLSLYTQIGFFLV